MTSVLDKFSWRIWTDAWLVVGLILIVCYPLAVVALSEWSQRLARQQHPLASTLRHVRNVTIPLTLVYVFARWLLGASASGFGSKLLLTTVLFSVVFALISSANDIFFSNADTRSWRAQVPKLFLDLSRGIVVTLGFVIIFSAVWKSDVGALVTALGVSSLVVGLALQDTLGSLFAGIGILFDRPFAVGDILRVGDNEGKVIGITWRSVRLLLAGNESVLVIPNNVLGKHAFINLSRPSLYSERVPFEASASQPPSRVKEVLTTLALDIAGVLKQPPPNISIVEMTDSKVRYEVQLYLQTCEARHRVRDTFLTRAWYASERYGLTDAAAQDDIASPFETEHYGALASKLSEWVDAFAVLGSLSDADKKLLVQHATPLRFAAGEVILREGNTAPALYILARGSAQLQTSDRAGNPRGYMDLGAGDVVGIEEVMLSLPNPSTVVATSDVIVIYIPRDIARMLMDRTPKLAKDLGEVTELRRRGLNLSARL